MRVEVRNLTKRGESGYVLQGVTFEVGPGEIAAIYGANGSGKSTFLRCLAGLQVFEDGQVLYDGQLLQRTNFELRKRVFYLSGFPTMLNDKSVLRNIGLALKVYDADYDGAERRVFEILKELRLMDLAYVQVGKLTHQQVYLVGVAMLATVNPDVWLMDDFLGVPLEREHCHVIAAFMREAVGMGKTVIYATNSREVAIQYADRVFELEGGDLNVLPQFEFRRNGVRQEVRPGLVPPQF